MIERDPRMQMGAYITDGIDLYEVTGMQRGPGVMGVSTVRIAVENCRNLRCLELLPDKVRNAFKLVRAAPVGRCPDVIEDIAWEPAPAMPQRRAA
ncbi:MAG: hypothetical protein JO243_23025 [Solirubrobacterales bacterium]|nr:hypothetical protein [Solirubrobacterales bacterium]